jgi:hypothetical protein
MPMSLVESLLKEMEEQWIYCRSGFLGHVYTRMCVQAQGEPWVAIWWEQDQELRWLG